MPAISGIYKILCVPTGKFYIGSSADTCKRRAQHWRALRAGKHHAVHLQRAWDKHGESSFSFVLLEAVPAEGLLVREQAWLDVTGCYTPEVGFNSAKFAEAPNRGIKSPESVRAKQSAAHSLFYSDPVEREKQSAVMKAYRADPSARAKWDAAMTAYLALPGVREKRVAQSKAQYADPALREKLLEGCRAYWAEPLARSKQAAAASAQHGSVEGRARLSEKAKQRFSTPAARKDYSVRAVAWLSSPETRAKMSLSAKSRAPISSITRANMAAAQVARHAREKQHKALQNV